MGSSCSGAERLDGKRASLILRSGFRGTWFKRSKGGPLGSPVSLPKSCHEDEAVCFQEPSERWMRAEEEVQWVN